MTFDKMLRTIQMMKDDSLSGHVNASEKGLVFAPVGQLNSQAHNWLLSHGFVEPATGIYLYPESHNG